jgi:hypothetical protein
MQRISAEEYKKRYGDSGVTAFTQPASSMFTTNPIVSTIKDIPSDISEAWSGAKESIAKAGQVKDEATAQVMSGEISPEAATIKTTGARAKAGVGVLDSALTGLLKLFVSPEAEEGIKQGAGKTFDFLKQSPIGKDTAEAVQSVKANYDKLTQEQKAYVDGLLGAGEAGLELTAFGKGADVVKTGVRESVSYVDDLARQALKSSDDVLTKAKSVRVPVTAGNFLKDAVNDVRFKLFDIDPQVETVLKRSNTDEVNTYFQQAQNAKMNPAKSTPLEIAGSKAEDAFNVIDEARKKAIEGKKNILNNVANERVSGNVINDTMSNGIQNFGEKFGVQVSPTGKIEQIKGRVSTLDKSDTKLVTEYFSKMNKLGVSPTVKQVDDFVDWAQSQLYKQSTTISKLESASDPVIRQLQGITGELNGKLKNTVGNGYGEVNARISDLITLQDELSRALGADARKGGGLMKTLFSPAGGNTRRIFQQIQDETGVDLFKEATLAKFAMENVGDVRQASLLKQLDIATKNASELDLTKPASIIKFLRENADLDGQTLANEIIRRSNASKVE